MTETQRAALRMALDDLEARCGSNASERGPDGSITKLRAALAESNDTDDVAKKLAVAEQSRDWYKRRTEALQQSQTRMRDPERTMVCDILANGRLLEPPGNRYATLAEPEVKREPVAWMYTGIRADGTPHERASLIWRPEYMDAMSADKGAKAIPLYTAPPRREWQGLTEPDIHAAYDWPVGWGYDKVREFAFAIEAALREKNA